MIEEIPISIIVLDDDKMIKKVNSCFKKELSKMLPKFDTDTVLNKKITDIIPEYSKDLYKKQVNVFLDGSILRCRLSVSVDNQYVYIELFRCTKYFMEHLAYELKTPVSASIELTNMISSSKENKKYVEMLKKNNRTMAAILVNTIDYLKIITLDMEVDISTIEIGSMIHNLGTKFKIKHDIGKNIWVKADKLRLIEVLFGILSYIDSYTIIKSKIQEDILHIFFTYSGLIVETDEVFKGFLEKEYSRETSCLRIPIAKGLLKLMGGDLILENSSEFSTTFKLILKIV